MGKRERLELSSPVNLLSKTLPPIKAEFRCIVFEEFNIRQDDPIYLVAKDELYNREMTEKYGPDWKTTWKEIERKKKRKKLEEEKRKYWMCSKGSRSCHERLQPYVHDKYCSGTCRQNRYKKSFRVDQISYPKCIDGHEICHDGIIQCPSCRDAKRPRNQLCWKCWSCKEHFHSLTPSEFEEHRDKCRKSKSNFSKQVIYTC